LGLPLVQLLTKLKQLFGSKKGKTPPVDLSKRFELLNRVGQGSMSKVWAARDRKYGGKFICLKVLDKEKTAKFEARFTGLNRPTEGAICMMMRHKNIVQAVEHGLSTKGEPFVVMEYLDGVGLNFLIETRAAQLTGNRINFLTQMAEGLEYIHKQKFLHRDICPRNVIVNKDNSVKHIDFGLAIPYRPEFCRPGNRTGTSAYLAPEIIKRITTDHRVDLFALGVTAYEAITGSLPWDNSRSMQTMLDHLNNPGRDPRVHVPDLDEPTRRFLIKAVERDPKGRFQTAEEFREALLKLPKR
jgi:serine/threonine protein kinase